MRLTWRDIDTWQRLKRIRLSQWEIDTLMAVDAAEPKNALGEMDD